MEKDIKSDTNYRNKIARKNIPSKYSILDVGGIEEYSKIYGKNYTSINLVKSYNIPLKSAHHYYNGKKLPYKKNSFDSVIAITEIKS